MFRRYPLLQGVVQPSWPNNGARGRIRDWTLQPEDVLRLTACADGEVVLTQLPLRIVLHMETPMTKKHPDYPEQHFPITPVTNYWNLSGHFGADPVEIKRRGYGMVPNFSTTIDGATGRTIDKGIAWPARSHHVSVGKGINTISTLSNLSMSTLSSIL